MPIEARKSLADTAYRLNYVHHVIQTEMDEIESAITEEDNGHSNIAALAVMMKKLSTAQALLLQTIELFPPLDAPR